MNRLINKIYYQCKPLIPRSLQLWMRRKVVRRQMKQYKSVWPILPGSEKKPGYWNGWPGQKQFGLILTHDVEWSGGQDKCIQLMNLEKELGFSSLFNFVPERYAVSRKVQDILVANGFEVGVHGLNHDGKLFLSKDTFFSRSKKINRYIKEWNALGFRSPAMHHNLDWIHELDIEYDLSTFDTDPFEPQSDGVGTIYPFWVAKNGTDQGYVELPYTLVQDFTLFILMEERNIDIWKNKLDWIAEMGGMALLNVHPDYMNFGTSKLGLEEFPAKYYEGLLQYVKTKYENQYWHGLPSEAASYFKKKYTVPVKNNIA